MRVLLTNFGTTGDVYPHIALATELSRRGHRPTLALSPYFEPLVEEYGLDFLPIGSDLGRIQRDINNAMTVSPEIAGSAEKMNLLFSKLASALPQFFYQLKAAVQNFDVLVSGPMQPAARMVHELTGVPFASVQVEHFGGGGTPAFQQVSRSLINPFRAQLKLPPLSHPLTKDANSPQLALYAMSRHVCPPPVSWPAHHCMTGFFFLDKEGWKPDPELVEFIEAGEPPVVFTFGSMTHEDPNTLTSLLLKAISHVGCRAIIQRGWSGLADRKLPPNVHSIGYVQYSWLFPKAACVVHHGGPGTAGAAFRAGVPQIFVPHAWDQPIWAKLAQGVSCAGPSIPYTELSFRNLSAAIASTLANHHYYQSAAQLSINIRAELGVQKARQLIERLLDRIGLS